MLSDEVIALNEKYFNAAIKSVHQHHGKQCSRFELMEASELFMAAFLADDVSIRTQPDWEPKKPDFYTIEVRGFGDEWMPIDLENYPIQETQQIYQ